MQDQLGLLYSSTYEFVCSLTLWNLIEVSVVGFCCQYMVHPFCIFLGKQVKAFCKPVMFSYQHVVITGGGTGLGKTLVQGIFTRGAIVTMVGKDEEKLE